MGRDLLIQGLIDANGERKVLIEGQLNLMFEKWSKLSTSSMNNMIHDAKVTLGGSGYVDSILRLKKESRYDFIHNNNFLDKKGT